MERAHNASAFGLVIFSQPLSESSTVPGFGPHEMRIPLGPAHFPRDRFRVSRTSAHPNPLSLHESA